jgi:hypothetical protein
MDEHFSSLAFQDLRLMGESDSTASQPPKPVCDWSVGRASGEVKGIFPGLRREAVSISVQTI